MTGREILYKIENNKYKSFGLEERGRSEPMRFFSTESAIVMLGNLVKSRIENQNTNSKCQLLTQENGEPMIALTLIKEKYKKLT